ncbi:hypothetical protein N9W44_00175 [Alphaproteobacteria bacterium]|nr:hypothetical protein [Alphaproteobacteria bacterium]
MLPLVPVSASPPTAAAMPAALGASVRAFDANIVPSGRQTMLGITGKPQTETLNRDYSSQPRPMVIHHPRQAPSSVSSEQFLAARSLMAPVFQHNVLATKMARISNLHAETPRFRDQIDILA